MGWDFPLPLLKLRSSFLLWRRSQTFQQQGALSMNEHIAKTPHFQEVNGINLHYVTWGEFTRPERAILLIHGLSFSHQEWSQLGPILAERGWFAIAPDLRGRGQSD